MPSRLITAAVLGLILHLAPGPPPVQAQRFLTPESDLHATRLFFSPTAECMPARSLRLIFYDGSLPVLGFGTGDRILLSWAGSWATAKLQVLSGERFRAAVGYYARIERDNEGTGATAVFQYQEGKMLLAGGAFYGSLDADHESSAVPFFGGSWRPASWIALIGEHLDVPGESPRFMLGARFTYGVLSADLAIGVPYRESSGELFPVINIALGWERSGR